MSKLIFVFEEKVFFYEDTHLFSCKGSEMENNHEQEDVAKRPKLEEEWRKQVEELVQKLKANEENAQKLKQANEENAQKLKQSNEENAQKEQKLKQANEENAQKLKQANEENAQKEQKLKEINEQNEKLKQTNKQLSSLNLQAFYTTLINIVTMRSQASFSAAPFSFVPNDIMLNFEPQKFVFDSEDNVAEMQKLSDG